MSFNVFPIDPHSYSNPNEVRVTSLSLDLKVDFESKNLTGTASWKLERIIPTSKLILDTNGLKIIGITDNNENDLNYFVGVSTDHWKGNPLHIDLLEGSMEVIIHYQTGNDAMALQWLDNEQTEDKTHPFLFTQSQAILCRTWIPCQDSPAIRFQYQAQIQVPNGMMALMSAKNPQQISENGIYHFIMDREIPSYLMALAVGALEFKSIDHRTGVYAEPSMVEKSVWEFEDTGKMVNAAEDLYGAFLWNRYDLLILPPSFPFGGMENPELTFCTPTVIAGDRSLTSLIAHELAHSWSGNLVTNATWNDFWLNEGFTVYFERRIMEYLYGKEYADMLAVIGYGDLVHTIENLGVESPLTQLKLALEGLDADEGMSPIAYEKGYFLLIYIESLVGREKWDLFVKTYFHDNAFKSMDTERFITILYSFFPEIGQNQKGIIHKWIYEKGLPKELKAPFSQIQKDVETIAQSFVEGKITASEINASKWTTHEFIHFLRHIIEIDAQKMEELDKVFHFSDSGNAEILAAWFPICIKNGNMKIKNQIKSFLLKVGRRKFVLPIYKDLLQKGDGFEELAREIYKLARKGYHPVTFGSIDILMG